MRAAADLEDVELALVAAGYRLEALHAGELALERAVVVEGAPINDLHRAVNAKGVPGQPDLAVAALADAADERVIGDGNGWNVARAGTGGWRGGAPRGLDGRQWIGIGHEGQRVVPRETRGGFRPDRRSSWRMERRSSRRKLAGFAWGVTR